jgi:hypothetical protein
MMVDQRAEEGRRLMAFTGGLALYHSCGGLR